MASSVPTQSNRSLRSPRRPEVPFRAMYPSFILQTCHTFFRPPRRVYFLPMFLLFFYRIYSQNHAYFFFLPPPDETSCYTPPPLHSPPPDGQPSPLSWLSLPTPPPVFTRMQLRAYFRSVPTFTRPGRLLTCRCLDPWLAFSLRSSSYANLTLFLQVRSQFFCPCERFGVFPLHLQGCSPLPRVPHPPSLSFYPPRSFHPDIRGFAASAKLSVRLPRIPLLPPKFFHPCSWGPSPPLSTSYVFSPRFPPTAPSLRGALSVGPQPLILHHPSFSPPPGVESLLFHHFLFFLTERPLICSAAVPRRYFPCFMFSLSLFLDGPEIPCCYSSSFDSLSLSASMTSPP